MSNSAQHTSTKQAVNIAEIAHRFGGFYESGAWRFPSPDLLRSFLIALEAAEICATS
jgi:hypothetical protein